MDCILIKKQKHIQFCLLLLITCAMLLSSVIVYLLCMGSIGWVFNLTYTIVFLSAVGGSILLPIIIFFILRAFNKSYYVISSNGIKFFKSDKEIFTIANISILRIAYLGFQYAIENDLNGRELNWHDALGGGGMQALSGAFAFGAGAIIGVSGYYNGPGVSKFLSKKWM